MPREERLPFIQSELRKLPVEQLGSLGTLAIYANELNLESGPSPWEWAGLVIGIGLLLLAAIFVFLKEDLSRIQKEVARVFVAFGPALAATAVPGFIHIKSVDTEKFVIRAGGGFAVFIIIYLTTTGII